MITRIMSLEPNYFDETRFTGFSPIDGFVAEKALKSHYNGAAKLHMTCSSPGDTPEDTARKALFFEKWKDWRACLDAAKTPDEKTAFHYFLRSPDNFIGFLWEIPKETLAGYYRSYQEHLWNKLMRRVMENEPEEDELAKLKVPLFSRGAVMPDRDLQKLWDQVLAEEKIEPGMHLESKMKKVRFLPGERPAVKPA